MPVFDLDKLIAENKPKKEQKPFTFKLGGETYELPPELDAMAMAALNEGGPRANEGLRKLLGGAQYDRMLASPVVVTDATLRGLFNAYAEYMLGVDMGESSASSDSSRSTPGPSKPTSKRTTTSRSPRSEPKP